MFIEEEAQEGLWNKEKYIAVAKNIRPDHLALLTDAVGACSIADGCGIRNNEKVEIDMEEEKKKSSGKLTRTKFSTNINQKQEVKVSEKKKTPCCEDLVDELIANERTKWEAEDKEWLLTLEETRLGKMIPEKEEDPVPVIVPEVNKAVVKVEKTEKPAGDNIELLSEEDKAALSYGRKQLKERREAMIKGIQDNVGKEIWPDGILSAFDEDSLERVFKSVAKEEVADYSLNRSASVATNSQEHLYPAGVMVNEETKKGKE